MTDVDLRPDDVRLVEGLADGQGRINLEIVRHLAASAHEFVLVSTEIDPRSSRPGRT